jgi:microcystin-dependent protein
MEVQGAVGVTQVYIGQNIQADLSATLRNPCTFSGYIYNATGVSLIPQLVLSTCNAFNNFNAVTDVSTTNLQSCPANTWTYVTDTVDLTSLSNVANGLMVSVSFGGMSATADFVLFSRMKFQVGEIATPFTDDVSLFVQTPSVDSTMLQDGCIARPSLFLPNVVPLGAYVDKSILDAKLADNTILARSLSKGTIVTTGTTNSTINVTAIPDTTGMAAGMPISGSGIPSGTPIASIVSGTALTLSAAATTSGAGVSLTVTTGTGAVVGALGYTPINKAGDVGIGPGSLGFVNDSVVGSTSPTTAALLFNATSANAANDGYMPALAFNRPSGQSRSVGLAVDGRLRTVDGAGVQGYLLDSVHGVDTNSYQAGSITLAALAQSLINIVIPAGMIRMFAGPSVPGGWLVCDGSAVSRTTYSTLFTAIGGYWGAGDGVTTFNLPDLRGRSPLGYVSSGGSGLTGRGFGSYGGEENHVLSLAELANHNHGITQNPHSHSVTNAAGVQLNLASGAIQTFTAAGSTTTGGANANISLAAAGGNGGHNTMMPFAVMYFLIKT